VLFALGEPLAFVALVVAFLLGLVLRALAMRFTARTVGLAERRVSLRLSPREDIDPFGAVAAAVGGMGWGKQLTVDEVPRYRGRGRAAAVFIAGPVACILAGELLIAIYALVFPETASFVLSQAGIGDILRGVALPAVQQMLLSLGVGLLAFGLLALIPIPPLDGFGILWNALRRPGPGMAWLRLWFEDKNLGVLLLLIFAFFPTGYPLLHWVLDFLGVLFLRVWA
jgi:Zn-dependent protease